jgi:dipeptidase E
LKILLGGGGSSEDERPLHEMLVEWTKPHCRFLYWPVALRGIRTFESCLDWFSSTFAPLGVTDITMWTDLTEHQESELDTFHAVCIGGGHTFSLLNELQERGFDRYLKSYAIRGRPVYGGSAGAIILGRDIQTARHLDTNIIGIPNTAGLDFAQRHAIWPHYEAENDESIFSYVREHGHPVIALSERSGVIVDGDRLYSAGFERALRFDMKGKSEVDR